ncbi:MAG: sugar transferase [Chloroflexi bacterium]|nr:sugar transferase [Chloroflexota bacterium]
MATSVMVLFSPLFLLLLLLVRVKLGTPVLFRQERPGQGLAHLSLLSFGL